MPFSPLISRWAADGFSKAALVRFGAPLGIFEGPAASMNSRTVVFLVWEVVGCRDGGATAALICSDSFCFVFLADDGSDAELVNCDGGEFPVCKPACDVLLFFDCSPALTVSFWGGFSSSSELERGGPRVRAASWLIGGVSELAAALQCGR